MKNEIFEKMHEKMTPREETVQELFAKAEASSYSVLSESRDERPSADNTGGIIMSMSKNTNGAKISEVRNHRAGFAVAAAAALVLAVGAGAYGLHKSTLDDIKADKTAGSAAASSQTETDSGVITEEEAKAVAAELLEAESTEQVKWDATDVGIFCGVECYKLCCYLPNEPDDPYDIYVPTGKPTSPDQPDTFMTDTNMVNAIVDADMIKDGFEAISIETFEMRTFSETAADIKTHMSGYLITVLADGKKKDFFFNPTDESNEESSGDSEVRKPEKTQEGLIDTKSLTSAQKAALETASLYNMTVGERLDILEFDEGGFGGEPAYNITFRKQAKWRRYPEDSNEYTVHISKKDNSLLPRIGEAGAKLSLEEAERIILEQKGLTVDDLEDKEIFFEGLEYFGGELGYVFSYEEDNMALIEAAEAKGEYYPYNFGIQTAIVSAETGDILRRTAMTEYEAKQKALEFVDPTLASGVEKFPKPEVESVNYDSANPNERYNFVCRLEGYDTKCHVIVPTGSRNGPETDDDPYENEPVIAKALEDAVIGDDEYDILACAEDESGSRVRFKAHGMIFSYAFDKSGNIVVKQCANGGGTVLAEPDMTEYEARRTVLRQLGYTLADPNEFSAYSGTNDEGEHGWIFEFSADGKSYKYFVVYKENAADASERFILKDMS